MTIYKVSSNEFFVRSDEPKGKKAGAKVKGWAVSYRDHKWSIADAEYDGAELDAITTVKTTRESEKAVIDAAMLNYFLSQMPI